MSISFFNPADLKTPQQKTRWKTFKEQGNQRFTLVGGTTYQFSIWAVRSKPYGKPFMVHTPFDPTGRYVKRGKRLWNKGEIVRSPYQNVCFV